MLFYKLRIVFATFAVLFVFLAPHARADLIAASGQTNLTSLRPLDNGLSVITLVWPIDPLTEGRARTLVAGLQSVLTGGTSTRTPQHIDTFVRLKGIEANISARGHNLLLTLSALDDNFPEALVHLENLLLESDYSSGWYSRNYYVISPNRASRTGVPSDAINEISHFLQYGSDDDFDVVKTHEFRFGRPNGVILRSDNKSVRNKVIQLVRKLPGARSKNKLLEWISTLTNAENENVVLPKGIVHFSDPASSEMLIMLVKAENFENEDERVASNLLLNYIGGNSGSEMFRTIRQEMRAAYDPRSDFTVLNKSSSVISLSASVDADEWPKVYSAMNRIYNRVRSGEIDRAGLEIQLMQLRRLYSNLFFFNPIWASKHFLDEYPKGADGQVVFPFYDALETASVDNIVAGSETYLPPWEDFLLVLIGGGADPNEALKSKGYCALPKRKPLRYCLNYLSGASN